MRYNGICSIATLVSVAIASGDSPNFEFPNHLRVLEEGVPDTLVADMPSVIKAEDGLYVMYFRGVTQNPNGQAQIMRAASFDGMSWTEPIVVLSPDPQQWDSVHITDAHVILDGGVYKMWYTGSDGGSSSIGHASSIDGIEWTKHPDPVVTTADWHGTVLRVGSVIHETKEGVYKMWYTGGNGYSHPLQVGYATSPDGIIWTKQPEPIFTSGESVHNDNNNVEVIVVDGSYEMYFSSSTGDIRLATSLDGMDWTTDGDCSIVARPSHNGWDSPKVAEASVLYENGIRRMWYRGGYGTPTAIGFSLEAPARIPGDNDGNGEVNVDDLLAVINAWGICP